jgi:hypothetical protein
VISGTTDRGVRLAALSWEVEAVPELRQALYQPDPITAAVDALALCHQMADYFETGPGREAVGAASADCAATCEGMAEDVLKAMTTATKSGDVPKLRAFARQWATDHPIRGSIAERESSVARMSDFLSAEGLSPGERVAEVSTTLDDMNRKLEVYSDQLVRQARWEAQRLKTELIQELRLDQAIPLAERAVKSADQAAKTADQAVRTIDRLSPAVDRSLKVAEDVPALVGTQREMAVAAIRDEATRAMKFAREERLAATADLKAGIIEQRKHVAAEAGEIAAKQIDYAVREITWLVALVMSPVLAVALLGVLLVRRLPPRRAAHEPHRRVASNGPKAVT